MTRVMNQIPRSVCGGSVLGKSGRVVEISQIFHPLDAAGVKCHTAQISGILTVSFLGFAWKRYDN